VRYFRTRFLKEADEFLAKLDQKAVKKMLYSIDLAEQTKDPRLFKKIRGNIWEFRSKYLGKQNRLLAFWDKSDKLETLVLATHGFVKKDQKIPHRELDKAEKIRKNYFARKNK